MGDPPGLANRATPSKQQHPPWRRAGGKRRERQPRRLPTNPSLLNRRGSPGGHRARPGGTSEPGVEHRPDGRFGAPLQTWDREKEGAVLGPPPRRQADLSKVKCSRRPRRYAWDMRRHLLLFLCSVPGAGPTRCGSATAADSKVAGAKSSVESVSVTGRRAIASDAFGKPHGAIRRSPRQTVQDPLRNRRSRTNGCAWSGPSEFLSGIQRERVSRDGHLMTAAAS